MNKAYLTAFNAIADIAATNWYIAKTAYFHTCKSFATAAQERLGDNKAMTFRKPNFKHATGYIAFLFFLANCGNGFTRRELCEAFKMKSVNFTMNTLTYAGLVKLDTKYTHKFTITSFGRAYLALAELARPALDILAMARDLTNVSFS